MKKLYLVRHAQSESNVNFKLLQTTPNPVVNLSAVGQLQAQATGKYLGALLEPGAIIWNSPYYRTRQTADAIKSQLSEFTPRESIHIAERQFGLVDDVNNYKELYPHEANHYDLHSNRGANFFARPPLGESPFDMCLRLDSFINTEIESSEHQSHVVVSHGAALRGIVMLCLRWPYEKYGAEPNSANAAVRLLEQDSKYEWHDRGYVFKPEQLTH